MQWLSPDGSATPVTPPPNGAHAPGQYAIERTVWVLPHDSPIITAEFGVTGVLNDVLMPSLPAEFSIPAEGGA